MYDFLLVFQWQRVTLLSVILRAAKPIDFLLESGISDNIMTKGPVIAGNTSPVS